MKNQFKVFLFLFWIKNSLSSKENSGPNQLFPPSTNVYNVTGPLNSFLEQLQANSRSEESVNYHNNDNIQSQSQPQIQAQAQPQPQIQPQPQVIVSGPQNRPILDPALQQLLNSFNTNPNTFDFNRLSQQQTLYPLDINRPIVSVSYVTCYIGCSHVTNILPNPNEAFPTVNKPNFTASIFFSLALLFVYILSI